MEKLVQNQITHVKIHFNFV